MNAKLSKYLPILDFLSLVLGEDTEVLLHEICYDCDGYEASIAYIKNSISERTVGAPGTDLLLQIIKSKQYKEIDFLTNYTSKSMNGKLLNSSSFFIKDETGNLIGMICVNTDKSKYIELEKTLESSLNSIQKFLNQETNTELLNDKVVNENLYLTAENSIEQAVIETVGNLNKTNINFTKIQKLEIVEKLFNKGFFELKDSISRLAKFFNMSEVSIYKYLQEIKNNKEVNKENNS